MNFKTAFIALSVSALSVVGLVGCGNDCDDAADRVTAKFEECGIEATDGGTSGETAECTEEAGALAQCTADCTEAADCGAFDGTNAEAATAWLECLGTCAPAAE
jgi:hypothetical protein